MLTSSIIHRTFGQDIPDNKTLHVDTFDINGWPINNIEYVNAAVENFKKTCWAINDLDLDTNIPWLAWCHAVCLIEGVSMPVVIRDDFDSARRFLIDKKMYFIEYTKERFITTL